MLKSITIESWECSLRHIIGACRAKKLTLRNNGHVIFVEKDFEDNENTSIITHKTFDKEIVKKLLDKAEKLFTSNILSSSSLSGFSLSNLFCQYIYVAFGKPTTARMSFSLNSPRRLWTILAVFSEELPLLNAASSLLLKRHSRSAVLGFLPAIA